MSARCHIRGTLMAAWREAFPGPIQRQEASEHLLTLIANEAEANRPLDYDRLRELMSHAAIGKRKL